MNAPEPPSDFNARTPLWTEARENERFHRFYSKGPGWDPIYYDKSNLGRLNDPQGGYGVLYCAARLEGAFAESFLRTPGRLLLPSDIIAAKGYVEIRALRHLRSARLHGHALASIGATAQVTHGGGPPYGIPQKWSEAIFNHPADFDGIAYNARHDDDQICYAIFDRAKSKVIETFRETDLLQDWFYKLVDHYKVGIDV